MGDGFDRYAQATNYAAEANSTRTNAVLARRQAYADAYKLEADSEQSLLLAGDNLMTLRRNQAEQVGARRAAAGASGFSASSGSNLVSEQGVAEVLEAAIVNAARSAAVSDSNARRQANALRRYGDTSFNVGMAQADYLQQQARIAGRVAPWLLVGGGLQSFGSLMPSGGFGGGEEKKESS